MAQDETMRLLRFVAAAADPEVCLWPDLEPDGVIITVEALEKLEAQGWRIVPPVDTA